MRNSITDIKDRRGEGEHPGLLLQRYLMRQASPDERRNLYDAVMQAARSRSLYAVYEKAFERWQAFSSREQACRSEQLATPGRLIIGLGSTNVLETGLRLHHTYGVPIIPGSALKGLASHYCHEVWGQRRVEMVVEENRLFRRGGSHHKLLFGTTDDGGVITFHDAWLTPGSLREKPLRLDVMTPHHPKSQTGHVSQTDFDSPVPVSFLSVVGTFDIRLAWAGPADTQPDKAESWAGLAMTLLKEALSEWG
ncbi:MAG: type III-B CRISPR module RAMP protein Cmr6, partial [Nitrospiraceae bacterium]|nr:type III-B CRISPR module RAMP protein Cmr6 [Nitrospiraceae bacterium]